MKSFKDYLEEAANSRRQYCPKCDHNSLHDKDYHYDYDAPDYDENVPPKIFYKCRSCGHKTEFKPRGKRKLKEEWQRAVMRKHGSVKPGYWHPTEKRFVQDKESKGGFDHDRLVSINAEVEVNGKTVAGKRVVTEESETIIGTSHPEHWENFTKLGEVDGRREGFGGDVGIYKATHTKNGKSNYFLKHPRLGHFRMVSTEHTLVRKYVAQNKKLNEALGRIPKDPQEGDVVDLYRDGPLGPGGSVGNRKIQKSDDPIDKPNKRHFSVSYMKRVTLKRLPVTGELGDQHGTPLSQLRRKYDIERSSTQDVKKEN